MFNSLHSLQETNRGLGRRGAGWLLSVVVKVAEGDDWVKAEGQLLSQGWSYS